MASKPVTTAPTLHVHRSDLLLLPACPRACPLPACLPACLQDGLKRCVNAVDLVHAVTALLECGSRRGPVTNFGDHVDKFWWVPPAAACCLHPMVWYGHTQAVVAGMRAGARPCRIVGADTGLPVALLAARLYAGGRTTR